MLKTSAPSVLSVKVIDFQALACGAVGEQIKVICTHLLRA
jgi:hypothetical protein